MKKRVLGNTGLEVSVLGFGGAPLGDVYGGISEADGARALHCALDAGVNFVDVAPYYGLTLAEERLGRALIGRRDQVVLASKCCRYDQKGFDFSAQRVHEDINNSLSRLKTDHLDLFQLHDIEFGTKKQLLEETLPAMVEVKKSGKARFLGITGLPVHLLKEVALSFPVDTVLSYCHYNLMVDDLVEELVPLVKTQGLGLINASPLHMGILSANGPQPWHPASREVKKVGKKIADLCLERGVSVVEVALGFVFKHPDIATTLCGMKSPEEVLENIRITEQVVDSQLLAEIDALVAPVKNQTWHEGLPENAPPATSGWRWKTRWLVAGIARVRGGLYDCQRAARKPGRAKPPKTLL
jgi:L-galactose dehydrogenase